MITQVDDLKFTVRDHCTKRRLCAAAAAAAAAGSGGGATAVRTTRWMRVSGQRSRGFGTSPEIPAGGKTQNLKTAQYPDSVLNHYDLL